MSVKKKLEEKSLTKQIFMSTGRLTIDSARHEWINPTTKIKHPGVVLELGANGYVELDLRKEDDQKLYARFKEWVKEGTDSRIAQHNVHELTEGQVRAPFAWWATSKEVDLLKDVYRSIESMNTVTEKEAFIEQCVLFEEHQEKPRKRLVAKLLDVEVDAPVNDPMSPKHDIEVVSA